MQDRTHETLEAWEKVDQTLRLIAKRRAQLDVAEARLLREALALEIWIPLGMVSALDYLERVLDYSPHAARERLRVAIALGDLPELAQALAANELHFSAVRELTRIAIPETQTEWIAAAKGRTQRDVEMLVSGREKGSRPRDPADPDLRPRNIQLKLAPDVYARFRQARLALEKEHGRHLDDNELIAALANAYLDGPAATPTERARHQIALTVCEICKQGWQEGGGQRIAVDAATVERAECDAQHIGSIEAEVPARAYQDIPPAVRRLVQARDGGRCRIPGCRSARNLDLHHLVRRADGGGHEPSNIVSTCSSCHRALHEGRLIVSGTAERVVVHRPGEPTKLDPDGAISHELDAALDMTDDGIMAGALLASCPSRAQRCSEVLPDASRPTRDLRGASPMSDVLPDASCPMGDLRGASPASEVLPDASCPMGDLRDALPASEVLPDASCFMGVRGAPPASEVLPGASRPTGDAHACRPKNVRGGKLDRASVRSQGRDALVGAGWTRSIACDAIDAALAENAEAPLEQVIRAALRFCLHSRGGST